MTRRFPITLDILPGMRWRGRMRVEGESPIDGGYQVQWDAEVLDPHVIARFVYDRCILTRDQIMRWTGVDLASP